MAGPRRVTAKARLDAEALRRMARPQPAEPEAIPPRPGLLAASPKVSAILLFNTPGRLPPARQAVRCLLQQGWPNRELIVVNVSGSPLLPLQPALAHLAEATNTAIVELRPEAAPLPSLLNEALDKATGDWAFLWPDDNWQHPNRIDFQMARRADGACTMLRRQVRCDLTKSVAFVRDDPWGIPGTLAFPLANNPRFVGTRTDCFRPFVGEWFGERCVVIDNSASPWIDENARVGAYCDPGLVVSLWHGANLQSREDFLRGGPTGDRSWRLPPVAAGYLRGVLDLYGLKVESTPKVEAVPLAVE